MRFSRLISLVESRGDPRAYGDGGMALTSYQCHPVWLMHWADRLGVSARTHHTWEVYVGWVVDEFWRHCEALQMSVEEAAMYYHMGNTTAWDPKYAEKVKSVLKGNLDAEEE